MIVRECVRALIEDEAGRVLLMHIVEPSSGRGFWITPGGGCEGDESDADALGRELYEETGLTSAPNGPLIWTRDFTFDWDGVTYRQLERFYWLKVMNYEPAPVALAGPIEVDSFSSFQWWTVDELEESAETFAPRDLAAQIRSLHALGPSQEPITLGA